MAEALLSLNATGTLLIIIASSSFSLRNTLTSSISGTIADRNLRGHALSKLYPTLFPDRQTETKDRWAKYRFDQMCIGYWVFRREDFVVRLYTQCCIDVSDGWTVVVHRKNTKGRHSPHTDSRLAVAASLLRDSQNEYCLDFLNS